MPGGLPPAPCVDSCAISLSIVQRRYAPLFHARKRGDTSGSNPFLISTISGNVAHSEQSWTYGGGIQIGDEFGDNGSGDVVLIGSTLSGNTNSANCESCFIQGGGAHAFGSVLAKYSTIRDNQSLSATTSESVARGGGLAATDWDTYNNQIGLQASTISGNIARGGDTGNGYGGGVAPITALVNAVNTTIAFNSANTNGGGISLGYHSSGNNMLVSTIIADNAAPAEADLAMAPYSSGYPVTIDGDHNLVTIGAADITLPGDTITGVSPVLLPLANNGGLTVAHALAACSPAIDVGSNPHTLSWDQRGDPFVREYGGAPDIGAFEWQPNVDVIFSDGFDPSPCP